MMASRAASVEGCANSSCIAPDDEMDSDYIERVRSGIFEGREQISSGLGIEGTAALREAIAEGGSA